MIPDPLEKKVVLPVRFRSGFVEFFYGGPLPALQDGVIGDLVVPAFAVQDQRLLGPLSNHLDVPVLPKGTRLLAGLRPDTRLPDLERQLRKDRPQEGFPTYAEIILRESLELRLRGTKRAVLKSCRCQIPSLDDGSSEDDWADSVNHAYSRLSMAFETQRRSHTGNVFQVVFYRSVDARRHRTWEPLEILRQRIEAKIALRFRQLAGGAS
jgi:hypothetical protein